MSNPFATADAGGFGDFDEFGAPDDFHGAEGVTHTDLPPPPPSEPIAPPTLHIDDVIIQDRGGDQPDRAPSHDPTSPPKTASLPPPAPLQKNLSTASSANNLLSGSGSIRRLNHNPFSSSKSVKAGRRQSHSSDDFAFSDDDEKTNEKQHQAVEAAAPPPPPRLTNPKPLLPSSIAPFVTNPQQDPPRPPPHNSVSQKKVAVEARVAETNPFAGADDDFECDFGGVEETQHPPVPTVHQGPPTNSPPAFQHTSPAPQLPPAGYQSNMNHGYQHNQQAAHYYQSPRNDPPAPPQNEQAANTQQQQQHPSYQQPYHPSTLQPPAVEQHQPYHPSTLQPPALEQHQPYHPSTLQPPAVEQHQPYHPSTLQPPAVEQQLPPHHSVDPKPFNTPPQLHMTPTQRPSDHWHGGASGSASRESSVNLSTPSTSVGRGRSNAPSQAMSRSYESFVPRAPRSTSSTFGVVGPTGVAKQPFTPLAQKSPAAFSSPHPTGPPPRANLQSSSAMFDVESFFKTQQRAPKVSTGLGGKFIVSRRSVTIVTTLRTLLTADETTEVIPECKTLVSSDGAAYASLFGINGALPRKPLDAGIVNSQDVKTSLMRTFDALYSSPKIRLLRSTDSGARAAASRGCFLFRFMSTLCDDRPFDWYGGDSVTGAADIFTILQEEISRAKDVDTSRLARAGFVDLRDDPFEFALRNVPPHRVFSQAVSFTRPPYLQSEENMPYAAEEAHSIAEGLVQAGDREEALRCALHYRQYTLALLLAVSSGDPNTYKSVIQEVVAATMDSRSVLSSAVLLQHDVKPPYLAADPDPEMARSWATHLSMLVSNSTNLTPECLIRWGDMLLEQSEISFPSKPATLSHQQQAQTADETVSLGEAVEAAHFCYLLAQLHPNTKHLLQLAQSNDGSESAAAALQLTTALKHKYNLVGGHYARHRCRASFMTASTILLTEALEYARQKDQQLQSGKTGGDKYIRPQLVPFRCVMAMLHAEMSSMDVASDYVRHVLQIIPPAAGATTIKTVSDVAETIRLTFQHQGTSMRKGDEKGTSGSGFRIGNLWPFGGGGVPSSTADAKKSAPPQGKPKPETPPTQPHQYAARPSTQPHPAPTAANVTHPEPSQPPISTPPPKPEVTEKAKQPQTKTSSMSNNGGMEKTKSKRWTSWLSLGRGSNKPAPRADEEEEEAKPMHLDTQAVPTFNPKTGKYEFPESEEERKIRELASRPPPPRLPAGPASPPGDQRGFPPPVPTGYPPMQPGGGGGFPPPAHYPPQQPPMMGATPFAPPMGGPPHMPPMATRYVDSFNS